MNEYLSANVRFPWDYQYKESFFHNKPIIEHELLLKKKDIQMKHEKKCKLMILSLLVKKCPNDKKYIDRF